MSEFFRSTPAQNAERYNFLTKCKRASNSLLLSSHIHSSLPDEMPESVDALRDGGSTDPTLLEANK
jgi:hypothetical protein